MKGISIDFELRKKKVKTSNHEDSVISEVYRILNRDLFHEKKILSNLKLYNKSFELIDEEDVDRYDVFHTNTIKEIAIQYRLKFLDSQHYKNEIPYEAILKIMAGKGQDIALLPRIPVSNYSPSVELLNERDVEIHLIEPRAVIAIGQLEESIEKGVILFRPKSVGRAKLVSVMRGVEIAQQRTHCRMQPLRRQRELQRVFHLGGGVATGPGIGHG